jgi:uncharacterized protein involved in outer membrane biogenesis
VKKLIKWLFYFVAIIVLLVVVILATAYWNRDILLTKLNAELNKGINGQFHIGKLDFTFLHDFPNFSVTLHNVYLRASHYEKYRQDIFSAEKIFVNLGMYPLFQNEVKINSLSVDNADIFVYKARNGDTNTDVFRKSQDTINVEDQTKETPLIFNLHKMAFHNVSVVFADSVKNKFINLQFLDTQQTFVQEESGYSASVKGDMHFDSLFLNPKGGSYLKDKHARVNLNVDVNRLTHKLLILPSSISYKKNEIGLKGDFELKKEGTFTLVFNANNINYEEVKSLLSSKLIRTLSKYKLSDPATVQVSLEGRQIPGYKPEVDVVFETTQKTFKYKTVAFSSLALKGSFTNHIDDSKEKDNKNSKVTISSFKALMEKIPITGIVTFTQLQDPVIELSFTSKGSFNDIRDHIDNSRFAIDKGNFVTAVKYRGKLSEYLDSTRTSYQGKLNGTIKVSDISLHYKPKQIHLDQIELTSSFDEKLFTIEKLNLNVNGSPVSVSGKIQNFIPFFIRPENKGYVNLRVHSPNFNLTSLTSRRAPHKKSEERIKLNRRKMSDLIDLVYNKLEFDIALTMEQFQFRKFRAGKFKGRLLLDNNILQANPVSMYVAEGTMNLNLSLKQVFDPISPLELEARIDNANIHELFLLFNNFNQKTIEAENLRGRISADVKLNANMDENYTLLAPSLRGTLDCKIANGRLKNFEPMENMSNFLFKKRDFSDVEFAELYSNFSIAGTNMDISRMEIQSSVVSMFLEGRYSFTDSTSLSVQLPLSNLKKRHKDFKPKNIGTDSKAGPSVYLHVYRDKDINSKIKIDYDPFKKWVRN